MMTVAGDGNAFSQFPRRVRVRRCTEFFRQSSGRRSRLVALQLTAVKTSAGAHPPSPESFRPLLRICFVERVLDAALTLFIEINKTKNMRREVALGIEAFISPSSC